MVDPIGYLRTIRLPNPDGCNGSIVLAECTTEERQALDDLRERGLVHEIAGLAVVTEGGWRRHGQRVSMRKHR